ncbi:MAG: DUF5683 domain-containing protein [Candidatus Poribacteria bacterium]|nr:DUF5683 domain-containing protein [Candidatus Poribacteria bacterium]
MQESTSDIRSDDISAEKQDPSVPTRSYSAMVLSALLPGLGQIYLGQFVKGCIILFVFVSAIAIFYINSYPVRGWQDLIRFQPVAPAETQTNDKTNTETDSEGSIHLWTLDSGKKLMFRPSWILKVTSSIQAIVCWIYAVSNGWRGRRKSTIDMLETD